MSRPPSSASPEPHVKENDAWRELRFQLPPVAGNCFAPLRQGLEETYSASAQVHSTPLECLSEPLYRVIGAEVAQGQEFRQEEHDRDPEPDLQEGGQGVYAVPRQAFQHRPHDADFHADLRPPQPGRQAGQGPPRGPDPVPAAPGHGLHGMLPGRRRRPERQDSPRTEAGEPHLASAAALNPRLGP